MDPEVHDSDKPASFVPPTVAPGAVPLRPYTPRPVPRSVPASLVPSQKMVPASGGPTLRWPVLARATRGRGLMRAAGAWLCPKGNRYRYRWPGTTVCTRCLGCVRDPGVGIGICQCNIRGSCSPRSNGVSPSQPPVPGGRGGCLPGGSDRQGADASWPGLPRRLRQGRPHSRWRAGRGSRGPGRTGPGQAACPAAWPITRGA